MSALRQPPALDRYRLLAVIGQGGMGTVHLAEDTRLARHVAVKILARQPARAAELARRFAAEALAIARVEHPNVVRIFDVIDDEVQPAYVMELLRGRSLAAMLREPRVLDAAAVRNLLLQSTAALAAVHRAGLVHRDVKPSNFFLAEQDGALVLKLLDFGVALQSGAPRLTRPGEIIGTPRYMAPEQITGGLVDARTDVFAWGVTACELVTGGRIARGVAHWPAPELPSTELWPRGVAATVQRCIAAERAQRPADMGEVLAALRLAFDDDVPPTLVGARARAQRRHPTEVLTPGARVDRIDATERLAAPVVTSPGAAAQHRSTPQPRAAPVATPAASAPRSERRALLLRASMPALAVAVALTLAIVFATRPAEPLPRPSLMATALAATMPVFDEITPDDPPSVELTPPRPRPPAIVAPAAEPSTVAAPPQIEASPRTRAARPRPRRSTPLADVSPPTELAPEASSVPPPSIEPTPPQKPEPIDLKHPFRKPT